MKDLFRSADELYKSALAVVNLVAEMPEAKPKTRAALIPVVTAIHDYEKARFERRKIIVEFESPMPVRSLTRRELTERCRMRKLIEKLARDDVQVPQAPGSQQPGVCEKKASPT